MTARAPRCYTLHLHLRPQRIDLRATGELDLSAVVDLQRLFASMDHLPGTLWCDLSEVTFIDTAAVEPFVQATRRRCAGAPVRVHPRSRPVQRVLGLHGLGAGDVLDVRAWDLPRPPVPAPSGPVRRVLAVVPDRP